MNRPSGSCIFDRTKRADILPWTRATAALYINLQTDTKLCKSCMYYFCFTQDQHSPHTRRFAAAFIAPPLPCVHKVSRSTTEGIKPLTPLVSLSCFTNWATQGFQPALGLFKNIPQHTAQRWHEFLVEHFPPRFFTHPSCVKPPYAITAQSRGNAKHIDYSGVVCSRQDIFHFTGLLWEVPIRVRRDDFQACTVKKYSVLTDTQTHTHTHTNMPKWKPE